MIRQFPKDHDERLTESFWLHEFRCRCVLPDCKSTYLSERLVQGLQDLRDLCGPLAVLSGYRCRAHNESVGGKNGSQHLIGIAADVMSAQMPPGTLAANAKRILVFSEGGIGIYSWGAHVDVRGTAARWVG